MNNLQRMIVLHPEQYNKLKDNLLDDNELSQIDKAMKTILLNKNLNDIQKWHLYRNQLVKLGDKRRKQLLRSPAKPLMANKNLEIEEETPSRTYMRNMSTQTSRIIRKHKDTQTKTKKYADTSMQTNPYEDVYETEPQEISQEYNKKPIIVDDDSDYSDNVFTEENIKKRALSAVSSGSRLKERKSINSSSVRVFETDDGSVISVPLFDRPKKQYSLRSESKIKQSELNFPIRKKQNISKSQNKNLKDLKSTKTSSWTSYT